VAKPQKCETRCAHSASPPAVPAAGERHAAVNGVRRNLSKGQRAMAVAKMLPDPENSRPHQSFTSV
jgi:hypothetical protein